MPEGMQCLRVSADTSGNAQLPELKLICYTFGEAAVFICLPIQFDYGLLSAVLTLTCHCHYCSQSNYVKMN